MDQTKHSAATRILCGLIKLKWYYDFHLKEFLSAWLEDGSFSTDIQKHQRVSDNEVLSAISDVSDRPSASGYKHADRIVNRKHFRPVYTRTRSDEINFADPLSAVYESCVEKYGNHNVYKSEYTQRKSNPDFPVLTSADLVEPSLVVSDILEQIPIVDVGIVFVAPEHSEDARRWFNKERETILSRSDDHDGDSK